MKYVGIIIATMALIAIGLLAFATPHVTPENDPKNNPKPNNNYEAMWKKVKDNLEKDLPESAEKELIAIEQQAEKDNTVWVEGNEPMITVYYDRIEILSRGTLAPKQTLEGFYLGRSIPVNRKLSEIFIQLHISEKSGMGVPKIVEIYGRDAFTFEENAIIVTIPFNWINKVGDKVGDKVGKKIGNNDNPLNKTRQTIVAEMSNNPNVTKAELSKIIGISTTAIDNNISSSR